MLAKYKVTQHIRQCMIEAFAKGDLLDAQNLDAFLTSLEEMSDDEYRELATEEWPSPIA